MKVQQINKVACMFYILFVIVSTLNISWILYILSSAILGLECFMLYIITYATNKNNRNTKFYDTIISGFKNYIKDNNITEIHALFSKKREYYMSNISKMIIIGCMPLCFGILIHSMPFIIFGILYCISKVISIIIANNFVEFAELIK